MLLSCFEVVVSAIIIVPSLLTLLLLRLGGWRPASPMWEPMLMCMAATCLSLMLVAALALWSRRR